MVSWKWKDTRKGRRQAEKEAEKEDRWLKPAFRKAIEEYQPGQPARRSEG